MSTPPANFERENRYIVIKRSDLKHLHPGELAALEDVCQTVNDSRADRGKQPIASVVVEHDWPEYEATWRAIEMRVLLEDAEIAYEVGYKNEMIGVYKGRTAADAKNACIEHMRSSGFKPDTPARERLRGLIANPAVSADHRAS